MSLDCTKDGYFCEKPKATASALNSTAGSICRYEDGIVDKGFAVVIESDRRSSGVPLPTIYKPVPPMEWASVFPIPPVEQAPHSTCGTGENPIPPVEQVQVTENIENLENQKPVPFGTLEDIHITKSTINSPYIDSVVIGDKVNVSRCVEQVKITQPIKLARPTVEFNRCQGIKDGKQCWYEAPEGGEFCGCHDGSKVTVDPKVLQEMASTTPYALGSRVLRDRFNQSRLPECPECGRPCDYDDDPQDDNRWEIYSTCGGYGCAEAIYKRACSAHARTEMTHA